MKYSDVVKMIEEIAPPRLQEKWDNSGIQVASSDEDADIRNIFVCLDLSENTFNEALSAGADFIVSHHPLFFSGVKRITPEDETGRLILGLINNKMSLYSAHTSFDSVKGGNNDFIAGGLGLKDIEPLIPSDDEGNGMGRTGVFDAPRSYKELKSLANALFGDYDVVRYCGEDDKMISKVGIVSGAGSDFIDEAIASGCDVFVTGDLKYHEAREALSKGICVIDGGHYGTEILFVDNFGEKLERAIERYLKDQADGAPEVRVIRSKVDDDPFKK